MVVVGQKKSNSRESTLATQKNNGLVQQTPVLQRRFNDFVQSLGDVLIDITALEINTMVVDRITGDKFIPWETYRDLYALNPEYLQRQNIHSSLQERYLELRRNLEIEYALLLIDSKSELYDPSTLSSANETYRLLTDPGVKKEEIQSILPDPLQPTNPEDIINVQNLLDNAHFLRVLRKISELKAALDNRNRNLQKYEETHPGQIPPDLVNKAVKTDIIYAQTVIQLDGDIINRYHEEIFSHPQRDLILQIHNKSVEAGEQQWRSLLEFVVDMVRNTISGVIRKL